MKKQFNKTAALLVLALMAGLFSCDSSGSSGFSEKVLFTAGETVGSPGDTLPPLAFDYYRIPAIVRAANGNLLAFCEGRKDEIASDTGDIDIILKISSDNGGTWNSGKRLADVDVPDTGHDMCMDPNLVVDSSNGRVWLAYHQTNGEGNPRVQYLIYSDDHGVTWTGDSSSDPASNPPLAIGTLDPAITGSASPGHAVQLRSGRLFFQGKRQPFYSDDNGATWANGGLYETSDPDYGLNESMAVELKSGSIYMSSRRDNNDAGTRRRLFSISDDGGLTWTASAFDLNLPGPKCQASIIRYTWETDQGRNRILFANPANPMDRTLMTVRVSYEGEGDPAYDEAEGLPWTYSKIINSDFSAYSDMVIQEDNRIGLFYETDGYETITYARFTLEWLTDGKDSLE